MVIDDLADEQKLVHRDHDQARNHFQKSVHIEYIVIQYNYLFMGHFNV